MDEVRRSLVGFCALESTLFWQAYGLGEGRFRSIFGQRDATRSFRSTYSSSQ